MSWLAKGQVGDKAGGRHTAVAAWAGQSPPIALAKEDSASPEQTFPRASRVGL